MGRSSSKSQANQTQTTNYTDRRMVNESGLVATEGSTIINNVQSVDKDIVNKALDFASAADATNGEGFAQLLGTAGDGFSQLLGTAERLVSKTSDAASTMAGRYTQDVLQGITSTTAEKSGTIDNKTLIVLGVAGAAALIAINMRK